MDLFNNLKNLKLFDMYGVLLTEKQRRCLEDYLVNNLTLSEISEICQISRQAVNYNLKETIKILQNYEEKLELCKKYDILNQTLKDIDLSEEDKKKIFDILKG